MEPWSEDDWKRLDASTRAAALSGGWEAVARSARLVLRSHSTSFFLVTRFLPPPKRAEVEVIYAAVRSPDEIVDSFPLPPRQQLDRLDAWAAEYEVSLTCGHFKDSLARGCSPFAAAFAEVVRRRGIPAEHYRAFLNAMRLDVNPICFQTIDDLIETYAYGSAIVVGYFLAYVYGPAGPGTFERALTGARNLGIALQLTNFLRDVGEDQRRGRVYLPADLLGAEGLPGVNVNNPAQSAALRRVVRRMASIADTYYSLSERDLDAFAEDSRVAIRACIDVYRRLNQKIGRSASGAQRRETVPIAEKFAVLPVSKYWKLPLAWAGVI